MTKRRNAVVVVLAALSLTMVPAAWAGIRGRTPPVTTRRRRSVAPGVSSFVVDLNAYLGQQSETAAFNAEAP